MDEKHYILARIVQLILGFEAARKADDIDLSPLRGYIFKKLRVYKFSRGEWDDCRVDGSNLPYDSGHIGEIFFGNNWMFDVRIDFANWEMTGTFDYFDEAE